MFIWIKISDPFSYQTISMGETIADIDNHIKVDDLLGEGADSMIRNLFEQDDGESYSSAPQSVIDFLAERGWKRFPSLWRSNGYVCADCFTNE